MALAWQPVDFAEPDEAFYFAGDPAELVDAAAQLLAVLRRPAWHAQAACRGKGQRRWFPQPGESVEAARAICAACPVRAQCAAAADGHGVWGGLSAKQRKLLRSVTRSLEAEAS